MTQTVQRLLIVLMVVGSLCAGGLSPGAWAQEVQPTVAFDGSAAVVTEGARRVIIPIRLSAAPLRSVDVEVALRGGTATPDDDVVLDGESASLTFSAETALLQSVALAVAADQEAEGVEFIDVVVQRSDVATGARSTFRLWIRDDSLYAGTIADALASQLRADFAPSSVLTASAAADSLLGVVWNEAGTVQGVFNRGQVRLTEAKAAADQLSEAGLGADPVWPPSQDGDEGAVLRRDLHALVPMHDEARRAHQSIQSSSGDAAESYLTPQPGLRGDVARALLYAHAMYPDQVAAEALQPLYATLADWMDEDPVDDRELQRTTHIAQWQGHPNPFVIAPGLAEAAFNLRGTYPTPTVAFVHTGGAVSERDSVAVLDVVASGVGNEPVTLTVALNPDASTVSAEDVDGFRSQTVSFPGGTPDGTVRRVRVPIVLDELDERTERATFTLRNVSGFTQTGETAQFVLEIENMRRPTGEGEGRIVLGPAYPNPLSPGRGSTVRFEISMDEGVPFTVEVFSALGQRVRMRQYSAGEAERLNAIEINAQDLPSGLYILRLQGPSLNTTETFVVVR